MYDSLLYGYGMTLGTLFELRHQHKITEFDRYLDFNILVKELIESENHSRLRREFNKLFESHDRIYEENRNDEIDLIKSQYNIVKQYGFERWISKCLFNKERAVSEKGKFLSYLVYNFWYSKIQKEILSKSKALGFINDYSRKFLEIIDNHDKIYTTNFDMIHDEFLMPEHLHGKFIYPLKKAREIIYKFLNEDEFEYKFLLGTNGIEKASRIFRLKEDIDSPFDDKFFFAKNLDLGHLLIYGLSFGKTEFLSNQFLKSYEEHKKNTLVMSVDGHILVRLLALYNLGKINKITISYYNKADIKNYKTVLYESPLLEIINFKRCKEIF
ncbi:MAG: hypothetical protein ACQERZ_09970 [Fusobacteriota bacterium]